MVSDSEPLRQAQDRRCEESYRTRHAEILLAPVPFLFICTFFFTAKKKVPLRQAQDRLQKRSAGRAPLRTAPCLRIRVAASAALPGSLDALRLWTQRGYPHTPALRRMTSP